MRDFHIIISVEFSMEQLKKYTCTPNYTDSWVNFECLVCLGVEFDKQFASWIAIALSGLIYSV